MNGKILLFDNSDIRYRSVAEKKAELGEYEKSLGLLFSIKDYDKKAEVVMDIADTYADMGLLELSNRYWYKYMDLTPKDKHSVAFEELAINYFYLEDFRASSYYFHKKIDTDGFLSKEGIDQEILDFFATGMIVAMLITAFLNSSMKDAGTTNNQPANTTYSTPAAFKVFATRT
jgi:tetratricopeptide (TPR) repeat protein